MSKNISRRSFLKGAAAGALGLSTTAMLGASAFAEEQAEDNVVNWSDAADLVIVGGGGAGFSAAIEAARAGSSVLILEKSGLCGGDTLLSGGMIMVGGTQFQKDMGIEDSVENFVKTEIGYCGEYADHDMVREMCEASEEELQFLMDCGREFNLCDPMMPIWAYDKEETWAPRTVWANSTGRFGLFGSLEQEVKKYDSIRVKTSTEASSLITNDSAEVIGVRCANGKCYRANKGVILATASFGRNKEMSKQYNMMNYWALLYEEKFNKPAPGTQSANNTGDGIRMAQELGADLMLSTSNCIADCCSLSFDSLYGAILVNDNAQRFVQENAHWGYTNQMCFNEAIHRNLTTPDLKFWLITDQASAEKNIYLNFILNRTVVTASETYFDLVVKADTLEEIAEKTGLPKANLLATVEHWNNMVEAGEDLDFHRKSYYTRNDFEKLGEGPYYAFPYIPYSMGSFGGLKTNHNTQVLNTSGKEIPRLYAAGSIISGMYTAPFYNACGWSVLGIVHFGRKAGVNVAALEPWTTEEVTPETDEQAIDVDAAIANANGNYAAGTYTAVGHGLNGDFDVTVTFSEKAITHIAFGEHNETPGIGTIAFDKLPTSILGAQHADVDTVGGATITSNAILNAVKDCIAQAAR